MNNSENAAKTLADNLAENANTQAQAHVIQLTVNDMTCGHCAATINQTIQRMDATAGITVDIVAKKVRVESSILDAQRIMAALEDAGFKPEVAP